MGCGMVRKVDELGRVVVPKEMRRVLGIKPGSSIEMSIDKDNNVVLKKFSEIENLQFFAQIVADSLFETTNSPIVVCDDEKVVVFKGISKKMIENARLSDLLKGGEDLAGVLETYVAQIKSDGCVCGYIILLSNEKIGDDNKKLCEISSKIFARAICS